jgi:hypothetical protein
MAANAVATVAATAWALLWFQFAGLVLTDTNLEAFKDHLTTEQGQQIVRMSESTLHSAAVPLLITNAIWFVVVAVRWLNAKELPAAAGN